MKVVFYAINPAGFMYEKRLPHEQSFFVQAVSLFICLILDEGLQRFLWFKSGGLFNWSASLKDDDGRNAHDAIASCQFWFFIYVHFADFVAGFCLWRTGFRLRSGPAEKRTRPVGH